MNGPRGRTNRFYTVTGARGALHFFRCLNLLKTFSGVVRAGGIRTSFILHPCPEQWYLQCFRLFVHTLRKGCGTRHVVTGVHALGGHAQKKLVFTVVFASLYNILRKDVTSVHAFGANAQNTGIYSVAVSLRVAGCGLRVNTLNLRDRNTM